MSFMSRSSKRNDKPEPTTPTVFQRQPAVREEPASDSYIGKTMKVEGELSSDENLTIEGKVKGTVKVTKTLTIGRYGEVFADIDAAVVRIIGKATGNIRASEKVIIQSEGSCSGNIWSEKLVVAEGAILSGFINEEPPKAAIPAQTESPKTEEPAAKTGEDDGEKDAAYDTQEVAPYKDDNDESDDDTDEKGEDGDSEKEEDIDAADDDAPNREFKKKNKNKGNKRRRV